MLNALTCEAVRIDDGGPSPAFYPVSILDVDLMKDLPMVYLKSEGGWLPETWYPLEDCQLFQPPAQRCLEELVERLKVPGCSVQVLRKAKASAPAAWYRGEVVSETSGIYAVDLQLLPVHRIHCMAKYLRLAQDPLPLTRDSIERVVLPVPPDAVAETTNEQQLQLFAQYGQFQFVQYDAPSSAIIVLVYGKSAARRAEILYRSHKMHARQRQKLRDEITQLRNDIRDAQTAETALFRCEFTVPPKRFVNAFGGYSDSPHLKRARHIDGIVRIVVDDDGRFVITATSEAAMNEAREILEIVTDVVYVEQPLVGHIIGKQGANVKNITKATGIIKLFIHTDPESVRSAGVDVEWKEGFAVCIITGLRAAAEAAKMLVDCQLRNDIRDAQTADAALVRCEFTTPPERFVDAFGGYSDSPHLKRARQIDGIVRILADKDGRFVITATSEAAMNEAREILEIVTEVVYVEQSLVGHIIGKQGVNVKNITRTTGIIKLFIHTDVESARCAWVDVEWKEGFAVCVITGSRAATENAKMLVDCQLDHKRQLNEAFMLRRQQSRRGGLRRKTTGDRIGTGKASTDDGERSSQNNEQRTGQRNREDHVDSQTSQEKDSRRRSVLRGVYHGRGRRKPGLPTREERRGSKDASSPAESLKRAAEDEPKGNVAKRRNYIASDSD